jgi:hypothetical protein
MIRPHFRPEDYRFDRQTGLRDYDFKDYKPPLDWPAIALMVLAVLSLLAVGLIGWWRIL